jgi:hypothetical protein
MQDRILGPLTLVQFVYAVVGGGISYTIYTKVPEPLNIVIVLPIVIFIICLDFVKINEQPFLHFFISGLQYISAPKQRFWHRGGESDLTVEIYATKKDETTYKHKVISKEEMEKFAAKTDTDNTQLIKI